MVGHAATPRPLPGLAALTSTGRVREED